MLAQLRHTLFSLSYRSRCIYLALCLASYLLLAPLLYAQQDNIPLNATFHAVDIYEYLKDMRVKKNHVVFS